jgi:hypothetical protein
MFSKIKNSIQTSYHMESLSSRFERIKLGVVFGMLAAFMYTLAASTINIISFPALQLGMDWISVLSTWFGVSIALAVAGAIAAWPTEDNVAIVGGGALIMVLLLVANVIVFYASKDSTQSLIQVLVTTLPLIVACVLLAWGMRWAINRHIKIKKEEVEANRRSLLIRLYFVIIVVGLIPGIFTRFDLTALNTINALNQRLQTPASDTSLYIRFPEENQAAIQKHFATKFKMYIRTSLSTIGALDVTMRFDDGYTVTCLVPNDGGQFMVIPVCSEGRKVILK